MFAVTISTVDANRPAVAVHNDHGVHAVRLARAAEVLDRFAGSI
jgi:hypothetical protein